MWPLRALVLLLVLVGGIPLARAQDAERFQDVDPSARAAANAALDRGERRFETGDYAGALAEFQRAYDLVEGHPRGYVVLYNVAQAQERLGRLDSALTSYRRYLDEGGPAVMERQAVEARIAVLERALREREDDPPDVSAAAAAGSAQPAASAPPFDHPASQEEGAAPWWLWAGLGALVAGAAVAAVLVVFAGDTEEQEALPGDHGSAIATLRGTAAVRW